MNRYRPLLPLALFLLIVVVGGLQLLMSLRTVDILQPDHIFYPGILLSSDTSRIIFFTLIAPFVLILLAVRSWRRTRGIIPRIIIVLFLGVYWTGVLLIYVVGLFDQYRHQHSLIVGDSMYHLVSKPIRQRDCDPYCYPPLLALFECDNLGLNCARISLLDEPIYEGAGTVNEGPYRFESAMLIYREETNEIEIWLNERAIYAYPLE